VSKREALDRLAANPGWETEFECSCHPGIIRDKPLMAEVPGPEHPFEFILEGLPPWYSVEAITDPLSDSGFVFCWMQTTTRMVEGIKIDGPIVCSVYVQPTHPSP
jgi:hypothetical protein